MNNVIDHGFETVVFDDVVLSDKAHELVVVGETIKIREVRHHFKVIIEVFGMKTLFDKATDSRCHDVGRFGARLVPSDQGYIGQCLGRGLLNIFSKFLLPE